MLSIQTDAINRVSSLNEDELLDLLFRIINDSPFVAEKVVHLTVNKENLEAEIKEVYPSKGGYVKAIRLAKAVLDLGLREAKEYVDKVLGKS